MTPTDTLREAVIDAILWSRWHEEGDVRGPEWFAAFKASYDDHHDQAKADAGAALSAIEAAGWRVVPVEPDADQIRAGLDDLGWWSEPQPEAREGGAIVDPGLSAEDSAFFNKQMMDTVASAYAAMLSAAPRLDATVRGEEG